MSPGSLHGPTVHARNKASPSGVHMIAWPSGLDGLGGQSSARRNACAARMARSSPTAAAIRSRYASAGFGTRDAMNVSIAARCLTLSGRAR